MTNTIKPLFHCLAHELRTEFRQWNSLAASLLYVLSSGYLIYIALLAGKVSISPVTWLVLYWLVVLFSGLATVIRSFASEEKGLFYFSYQLYGSWVVILSKIIINIGVQAFLACIALGVFMLLLNAPEIQSFGLFLWVTFSGVIGVAITLTLISAIASRADQSATLLAVLGLPLLIPQLVLVIKASLVLIQSLDSSFLLDEMRQLWALNAIAFTLSMALFVYLWRR